MQITRRRLFGLLGAAVAAAVVAPALTPATPAPVERGAYAKGGWVGLQEPELAWVGERGEEYVIPAVSWPVDDSEPLVYWWFDGGTVADALREIAPETIADAYAARYAHWGESSWDDGPAWGA